MCHDGDVTANGINARIHELEHGKSIENWENGKKATHDVIILPHSFCRNQLSVFHQEGVIMYQGIQLLGFNYR